ncbi:hypothetical protein [Haloglomus halophilum]|uniref:hypothetical protein n=1 Tax=Haloglomus halophilum TaxID=2962672 RepID=UPI0020C9D698|nr:hypothetical protein [Haloglomus halophilum]
MSVGASASHPTYVDGYYMDGHLRRRVLDRAPSGCSSKRIFRLADPAGTWFYPSGDRVFTADEVRTYWPAEVEYPLAFVIRGDAAHTIIDMEDEREDHDAKLSGSVERCSLCGGVHSYVTSDGCPYCNDEVQRLYINK